MDKITFKDWVEITASVIKIIGLVVGAVWVYLKFIRTREGYPKIQFELDLHVLGRQDGRVIIEVVAHIENKGLVRHYINDLSCSVLTLDTNDAVVHGGKKVNGQLLFKKHNGQEEDHTGRIIWIPKDWGYSFIDAGIKQEYTYLSSVPDTTSFISVYGRFHFKKKADDFQTAQKTFSVKQPENGV